MRDFAELPTVELSFREVDDRALLKRTPTEAEYDTLIDEDCVLMDGDRRAGVFIHINDRAILDGMRQVANLTKYSKTTRTSGLRQTSVGYGSLPRSPLRQDYCRTTTTSLEHKSLWHITHRVSGLLDGLYQTLLPMEHRKHVESFRAIHRDYRLGDGAFTSCTINRNHAIKYHRDRGNFRGVFSNILILRNRMNGGNLVAPEFRAAFAQVDGALLLFDGQRYLHGVTPIDPQGPSGYRCSVVFYAREDMKNCYPYDKELERAKRKRVKVEKTWRN